MSNKPHPRCWSAEFWLRHARKAVIAVIGGTVLLAGFAMLVLPGPAIVVIPAGLAILATEFAWARYWLRRARKFAGQAAASPAVRRHPFVRWLREKFSRKRG